MVRMLVSVVIPAANVDDVMEMQLACLERQSYRGEWEIVVADNGSTDDARAVCERWRDRLPQLRVVDASARLGCGAAKNQGVEQSHGDRLLFCDADDLVAPEWVEVHVVALERSAFSTGPVHPFPHGEEPGSFDGIDFGTAPVVLMGWLPVAFGCNMGALRSLVDDLGGVR